MHPMSSIWNFESPSLNIINLKTEDKSRKIVIKSINNDHQDLVFDHFNKLPINKSHKGLEFVVSLSSGQARRRVWGTGVLEKQKKSNKMKMPFRSNQVVKKEF